jgi:hypothetical protein
LSITGGNGVEPLPVRLWKEQSSDWWIIPWYTSNSRYLPIAKSYLKLAAGS